jgi:calcineurin-like phosphoesterase family protein
VHLSRWFCVPVITATLGLASARATQVAQPPASTPPPATVRAIEPPPTRLPEERASARIVRFSFVAYGDTRSGGDPNMPGDGRVLQVEHSQVVDRVISKARELASTAFPIRLVLHSGDAVLRGTDVAMWNVSFTPIIERLTRSANLPFFFAVGNHDVTGGEGGRAQGLANTLAAMAKLIPPEKSARRLKGYPTYAFGYGNSFFIAIDSNIPEDALQIAWVRDQLERLDRARYRHVIVFFHHPAFSSGPHSRTAAPGNDQKLADRPEPQTAVIRNVWLPLFRKYHVDLTITGHDHLFDHWVEHYVDRGVTYRMDHVVTGGGGAPIYSYAGEPDLGAYVAANATQAVRLDHPMRPGMTAAENPHHFVTIRVDGDRLSLEVTGIGRADFNPYNGRAAISLSDGST